MTSSNVLTRLQEQCDLPGISLDLASERSGQLADKQGLVVLDAEQEADIALIIAATTLPARPMLAIVGSMSAIAQQQIARLASQRDIRCALLAQLTRTVCEDTLPARLYLSGDDVAVAVAQVLGASGFQIQGLVAGCVPHGVLLNIELLLPVMTKVSGFGDENTLAEAIRFIEEKSSE